MLKYGDTREDGYVWVGKRYNIRRPDGSYADDWRSCLLYTSDAADE